MGSFSRDPKFRLDDAVSKHYAGVRMQQGVATLDTVWNELDDLRKGTNCKSCFKRFIVTVVLVIMIAF